MRREHTNFVYLEESNKVLNLDDDMEVEENFNERKKVISLNEGGKKGDMDVSYNINCDSSSDEAEEIESVPQLSNFKGPSTNKINAGIKPQNQMYKDDIFHILKYAEDNNPISLVSEVCAKLKWDQPDIESIQIIEDNINVYKTQIKLKHFMGEGIGITKKK